MAESASGNALRFDLEKEELYAQGKVLMLLPMATDPLAPHLRIRASELGMRRLFEDSEDAERRFPFSGEAKEVEVWLPYAGRHIRMRAGALVKPDRIVLRTGRSRRWLRQRL